MLANRVQVWRLVALAAILWGIPALARAQQHTPAAAVTRDDLLKYVDATGNVRDVTSVEDWNQRRRSVLAAMQSVMGVLPPREGSPPNAKVLGEVDCGQYVRRQVEYESQPGTMTSAYLCVPKALLHDSSKKSPAIVCLHPTDNVNGNKVVVGLGGKANRQYASELAARGFVTLAPSYPLLAQYNPPLRELGWESGTLKAVWDNMRGIDWLQSLPFVDGDAIGAIGHSLGGHNAIYTAVFDHRIKVIVSSCGFDSYRDYYGGDPERWKPGQGWTSNRYMPKLADYRGRLEAIPFDFPEMIAALAPRHFLAIAPLHDGNFRAESVDQVLTAARPVFRLYQVEHRLITRHPDCGHDFPPEMREAAYQLFEKQLHSE
ncbi:MAG: prolyl oligopeptidase family serine peptidase [Pirellulales bacterium]|nr:prolyl oligopeptidase family serine peptidase [Pirellulales bacterium]